MSPRERKIMQAALSAFVAVILLRTAWLSDDAQITLRSVLNFVHGFGPVYNVGERVQSFTHPLWFLLLSGMAWMRCNIFLAPLILSFLISLLTWWLIVTKLSSDFRKGIILGIAALLSKAFLEYSSSGLENPLTHLLLVTGVWFAHRGRRNDTDIAVILLAMISLNRPDGLVLVLPYIALLVLRQAGGFAVRIRTVLLAAALPSIWTAFSVVYYGFPLAVTAYAKLAIEAPRSEILTQGMLYLLDSSARDPLTLGLIFLAVLFAFIYRSRTSALAIGILLYLGYVVYVGGDFMSGRFLTLPFAAALAILAVTAVPMPQVRFLAVLIVALGSMSVTSTVLSDREYGKVYIARSGIADERGYYFQRSGLVNIGRDFLKQPDWTREKTASVYVVTNCGGLGESALRAGPEVHYIDPCGLVDPYLAKLPMRKASDWRVGHLIREVSTPYKQSIESGRNVFVDPAKRTYLDQIWLITRGELFSRERFDAIWRMNFVRKKADSPHPLR